MITGPLLPPGVLPVAVAILVACLTVKWAVPFALRMVVRPLQGVVTLIALALTLPEYLVSTASRRRHSSPPALAYDYGNAVGWAAHTAQRALGFVLGKAADAARAAPPLLIAVPAAALTIVAMVR